MTETVLVESLEERKTFWQVLTSEKYFKWTLIGPLLLTLAVFMLYPLFYCMYYSAQEYILVKEPFFIGLENYRMVLHDPVFWAALGRTFYILVVCIGVELILGMAIALYLNREFRGQGVVRGLCLLPLLISPLAMSLMWNYMLHTHFGVVNMVLGWLGVGMVEFFVPGRAIYIVMAMTIWQWLPFSIFVLFAGLRGLPKDVFEAARVDGASLWYSFRRVTLPMLMPLVLIIVLLRTCWLIRLFDPLYGTTRGGVGTELLDWLIYRVSFVFFDVGVGSTLAIISLFLTIIICAIMFRVLMKALGVAR